MFITLNPVILSIISVIWDTVTYDNDINNTYARYLLY